jgi:ABC-type branched-subunit amino acid transport system substrate-binding protein
MLLVALALAACESQAPAAAPPAATAASAPAAAPTNAPAATTAVEAAPTTAGAAPAAAPAASTAAKQEFTLGVVMPFTGSLGTFGTGFREGIELAVEQMNAQLGAAGSPISFKTASADTTGTPDGAAKAFQTVVQTSGAQVVVGPLSTSEVLGAKQFADQNKIVIVAPASTGMAGAIPDDYIFRVLDPPDSFAGQAFVGIATARGYKNVVVLHVDDPFGNGLVDIFKPGFAAAGGGEVATVKYTADAPDLSSEVTKVSSEITRLSASGKTAFFCVCFLGDAQKVIQLASVDPVLGTVEWLGVENLRSKDLLADATAAEFLPKVKLTAVSFAGTQNPNTQPFIDAYKAKFNHDPGPFTNYAYDAANIAMLSIVFAGNNGAAVQKVLPFIASHYVGTETQAFLDKNGDQAIANYGIYQINAGGTDFDQVGTYDGLSGKVTFETK